MSAIFSYEIDERNLRVQLKNLEVPLKEEAWQKFDSYARAHGQPEQRPVFQQLQFRLNRNVVMPAIFGTIILVFSLMLYNFVSIKKDKVQNTEPVIAPAASEVAAEMPATDLPAMEPAPNQIEKAQIIETAVIKTPVAEISAPKVSEPAETPKTVTAPENTTERTVNTEKNRQRKLDKATLTAIKPSVITEEEAEAEITQ